MFELDETPTKTAQACRRLVLDSGLPIERPGQEDPGSVTVVVYRWDPCDGYSYLTVSQGVRQVEPMYGPIVSDDQRLAIRGHAKPRHHRLGFKKREHTVGDPKQWPPEGHTRDASWYILVSFREEADRSKLEPLVDKLVPKLAAAIDGKPDEASTRKAREPLFPSLWHAERVARDRLRRAIRDLGHGWDLWKWAHVLTEGLRGAFHGWLPDCHEPHLGIYLFTGEYWALCGEREGSPWRPTEVHSSVPPELRSSGSDKEAERMNAFDWVQESCRPLLLRRSMHPIWRQRLDACGPEIAGPPGASRQKKYGGTCIVPLLDPFEFRREDRALGLIVLTALRKTLLGPGLTPGHLWLLSHLATSVSGYLAHLFAAPGFRYWPEAKVGCGRDVTVDWLPSQTGTELAGPTQKAVRRIVQALAPEGSTIQLQPLEPGRRSDAVCRLDVQDSDKLREIPRLLKLGPPDEIERELRNYYTYVHNKPVGVNARLETSCRRHLVLPQNMAAIIYSFVGASGDRPRRWDDWAREATQEEMENALDHLRRHLSCWYLFPGSERRTVTDLLILPLLDEAMEEGARPSRDPSPAGVVTLLERLVAAKGAGDEGTPVCVVHGDLHGANLFVLSSRVDKEARVHGVALVDWGEVSPRGHPLVDISRLLIDTVYRVRWRDGRGHEEEEAFAREQMQSWERALRCEEKSWILAWIHNVVKMLRWRDPPGTGPVLAGEAGRRAWRNVEVLADVWNTEQKAV